MDCYILLSMVRGITEVIYAYPHTPQGLTAAREGAKRILLEKFKIDEDYLNIFEQYNGETDSVLSGKTMKRWLIESGQTEKAESWFC